MPVPARDPLPPHDDDRFDQLYRRCKRVCVGYAARLLASSGRNRHLCAFEAEEFYDVAWETYYRRREYLQGHDDHVARLNALIRDRVLDEWRRSKARKRAMPAASLDTATAETLEAPGTTAHDQRLVDRDELNEAVAQLGTVGRGIVR
jgi:DNA-directed RNA polymerase specialized sigma24 family protein